ncbi:MAG TPA: hypothetical protein VFN24_08825 [Microbacterium sp.]|nr:hypothetical protein [Microbacterium sp.]
MADDDRGKRPHDRRSRPSERPRRDGQPDRDGKKPYRGGTPDRDGKKPYRGGTSDRDGKKPYRVGGRPPRDDARGSRPPQHSDQRMHAEPELPDEVTARDLHPAARNELKTLSKENADQVARHLAMAAALIEDDPARAHEHALAAVRRAGRVGVVRESAAITAYAIGDFALALRELRTYRRISGRDDQIALMVDSERGVGRPDRALEVGRAVDRTALPAQSRVELAIALSGARLDLGEPERALLELEIPELDPNRAFEWSPALFAARATVLEELGRTAEAAQWRHRAEVAADALDRETAVDDVVIVDEILEEPTDEDDEDPAGEGDPAPADGA